MRRLDVDTIAITETKINPSFLLNRKVVHDNIFRDEHHVDGMANDSNKLIGRRKKGRALLSVWKDLFKFSSAAGSDATGIGH